MSTATASTTANTVTRDRLSGRLREITGHVLAEVRVTPALYGGGNVWCVMALDRRRREVPLPGLAVDIALLLKRAFPRADWDRAQDYDVTTGVLTKHLTLLPACLRGEQL
jgi:hypothetical protein